MRAALLTMSLVAPDPVALFSRLRRHVLADGSSPSKILLGMDRADSVPSEADTRACLNDRFRNSLDLFWRDESRRYLMVENRYLKFRESASLHPDLRPLRHLFGHDFNDEFVVCDALWKWDGYMTPGFGGGLDGIGWFLALKGGLGHRHLSSRRILAYGPWRLLRMKDDVTFIEFHDPDTDEATALEQAKPGHAMMWNNFFMPNTKLRDDGDVLEDGRVWSYGVYDSQTRTLTHVVEPGRTLTHMDGIRLSAVRNYTRLDVGPIDQVDCLFMDESDAMEQRFGCWAYGQGCLTFRDGEEVDVLADFEPPTPEVPDWVRALDAKEGIDTDAVRAELIAAYDPPRRRPPKPPSAVLKARNLARRRLVANHPGPGARDIDAAWDAAYQGDAEAVKRLRHRIEHFHRMDDDDLETLDEALAAMLDEASRAR